MKSDQPEDLWDKPLIISNQDDSKGTLTAWIKKELPELNIIATYNLLFNASLMVEEGMGYAIGLDKIIHTGGYLAEKYFSFRLLLFHVHI